MPNEINTNLLSRARITKGLSQIEVARATGLSAMTVHRVEAGENTFQKTIKKIADYLGIPMRKLMK